MNEPLSPELEELHAYADGQLSPSERGRVEERLAGSPGLRRQVDDYEAIRRGLRALYDPVLDEPVPARMDKRPRRHHWLQALGAVAAGVLLLVAGGWIGMHLEQGGFSSVAGTPRGAREAAMAYAVYAPEMRHPVEVPGDQEEHLVTWLTKRIGATVHAPSLDALGFTLIGGRLLSSDDGPGALLMYENTEGKRVVLYASKVQAADRPTAFRFARDQDVSVFYWREGALFYALAGELDRAGLLALAESVYRQIAI